MSNFEERVASLVAKRLTQRVASPRTSEQLSADRVASLVMRRLSAGASVRTEELNADRVASLVAQRLGGRRLASPIPAAMDVSEVASRIATRLASPTVGPIPAASSALSAKRVASAVAARLASAMTPRRSLDENDALASAIVQRLLPAQESLASAVAARVASAMGGDKQVLSAATESVEAGSVAKDLASTGASEPTKT